MKSFFLEVRNILNQLLLFPQKIPYSSIRWGGFFFLLVLLFIEINYFNNPYLQSFSTLRLIAIIIYLFLFIRILKKQNDTKDISELIKDICIWFQTQKQREKRLETGYSLATFSSVLFFLHLFFRSYNESSFWSESVFVGWQTTLGTFLGVIIIPSIALISILNNVPIDRYSIYTLLQSWGMAIIFSIGNIILISAYSVLKKLETKSYRRKHIFIVVICMIFAFFSPSAETFCFGYILWVFAFFSLFVGLLIIDKNSNT